MEGTAAWFIADGLMPTTVGGSDSTICVYALQLVCAYCVFLDVVFCLFAYWFEILVSHNGNTYEDASSRWLATARVGLKISQVF